VAQTQRCRWGGLRAYEHDIVRGELPLPQPLCERPRLYSATHADCAEFRSWATLRVQKLGPSGLSADGGPTPDELMRELRWLSEDAGLPDARFSPSCSGEPSELTLRASLSDLMSAWESRLADRVPFQYLTASAYWRDLVLVVGPGALCPRPETELIIDAARDFIKAHGTPSPLSALPWVDLGTGTGALAIAIAQVLRESTTKVDAGLEQGMWVHAVDVSPTALRYADANVRRYGLDSVGGGVRLHRGSWFSPLPGALRGKVAGVVSNPPYIPTADLPGLMPEVSLHEPRLALDGGYDGNEAVRMIAKESTSWLAPGGFIILEVAAGGAPGAEQALKEVAKFSNVRTVEDFAGHGRFVSATFSP